MLSTLTLIHYDGYSIVDHFDARDDAANDAATSGTSAAFTSSGSAE